MAILVVGASGLLGFQVCRALKSKGVSVRALTRPTSPRLEDLEGLGASLAVGDLKQPATLRAACEGVEAVVTTATAITSRGPGDSLASVDRDGQLALLEAARGAGVRRFVYVSVSPNIRPTCDLIRSKREVEREVRGSGLEWVILQPPAFMDIWFSGELGWDLARGRARVFGKGDRPVSFVAIANVARVAAESAVRSELGRRELPFGGPEAMAPREVVRIAEEITGRKFRVQHAPVPVLKIVRAVLASFAPVPASLLSLGISIAENGDAVDGSMLWRELGLTPTTVRQFLEAAVRRLEPHRA